MKDFLRHNGILILIIAVLLAAITAVASYALKGTANPLSNALGVVTTPIRNGVSSFVGWAEGVYNYSFRYQELEEENQRLRSQIAELEEKGAVKCYHGEEVPDVIFKSERQEKGEAPCNW